MRNTLTLKQVLAAGLIGFGTLGLVGCSADGDGSNLGGGGGGGTGTDCGADGICGNADDNGGFGPNDGTNESPVVTDNDGDGTATDTPDDAVVGTDPNGNPIVGNFVCDAGVPTGTTTTDGSGGLVGGAVSDLLDLLGGGSLPTLTNSVVDAGQAIDYALPTYSTFTVTASGLGILNFVAQDFRMGRVMQPGEYAVVGVSFPTATVEASLANSVVVTTFADANADGIPQDAEQQETMTVDITNVDLLGAVGGNAPLWLGLQAKQPFNLVRVSQLNQLISANVGESMYLHEMCTDGHFVAAP